MSSPKDQKTPQDLRKVIAQSNRRRREEEKTKKEEEASLRKVVRDEETEAMISTSQYLVNAIVGIVFLSCPLSEPTIDWLVVLVVATFNVVWNFWFHRHTWQHVGVFVLSNLLLVQWGSEIWNAHRLYGKMPPEYWALFAAQNVAMGAFGYCFFLKESTKDNDQEWRQDVLVLSMMAADVCLLVYLEVVPVGVVLHVVNSLKNLLVHFSLG
jgi:hypothetical protein